MANRDHLTWTLLQFVSGSMLKISLSDLEPVIDLLHVLYPESQVCIPAGERSDARYVFRYRFVEPLLAEFERRLL